MDLDAFLAENQRITTVGLSGNGIAKRGASALWKALQHSNNTLIGIDLGNNNLGNVGVCPYPDAGCRGSVRCFACHLTPAVSGSHTIAPHSIAVWTSVVCASWRSFVGCHPECPGMSNRYPGEHD